METVGGVVSATAETVRLKLVVLVTPPPVPVTVMVYDPVGVEDVVLIVSVVVQVGLHDVGE